MWDCRRRKRGKRPFSTPSWLQNDFSSAFLFQSVAIVRVGCWRVTIVKQFDGTFVCVCVCARQRKRHASTSRGGISVCTGEKWSFFRQHLVGRWVEIRSETEMNRRAELSTQTPNECHLRVHRARASVVFCAVIFGIYCDSYFSHFLFHARRRGAPRFAC